MLLLKGYLFFLFDDDDMHCIDSYYRIDSKWAKIREKVQFIESEAILLSLDSKVWVKAFIQNIISTLINTIWTNSPGPPPPFLEHCAL